jgi:DNA-binding transcriptional LysR family regulator
MMVIPSIDISELNEPNITVPNFGAISTFIKGTDLITTQLGLMKHGPLKDLDSAPLPFDSKALTVFLAWHQRDHEDPAHRWLRHRISETVESIFADV